MTITLDELLHKTGLRKVGGVDQPVDSGPTDLAKLAEQCRRAADATPNDEAAARSQGLVEKTAAVEIIRRTLAEIRTIEGAPQIKTASSTTDHAAFIKAALEEGHPPEAIAKFLERPPKKPKTSTSIVAP